MPNQIDANEKKCLECGTKLEQLPVTGGWCSEQKIELVCPNRCSQAKSAPLRPLGNKGWQ